jgi:hypothetical protein
MTRYYFDLRDGDELTSDEVGLELASFHAAQEEAARSLADMAKDAIQSRRIDGSGGLLAVEVRDENGPVLQARFTVDVN